MKLQVIKPDIPIQQKEQENVQSVSEIKCLSKNDEKMVRYYVLEFPSFQDVPVVVILDLNYLSEAKSKYKNGSFWSIEALKKFIKNTDNHDPDLFRAINFVKSIFGGRLIR